jgi:hypothetical protein
VKPLKPSLRPEEIGPSGPAIGNHPQGGRALAASISACAEQLAAFARVGTNAPRAATEISLDGFDRFVPDLQRGPILEARLDGAGRLVIQPSAGTYPEPTGNRTVVVGVLDDQVTYTAARHWIDGQNHFGQDSNEFPFCLVNLPKWRRTPCDLRAAEWYRSEEEALAKYAYQPPAPEPDAFAAKFSGGVRVELRRESSDRWLMLVKGSRPERTKDFATPFLDHAKRTAVLWFGEPIEGWTELRDAKAAVRRQANEGQMPLYKAEDQPLDFASDIPRKQVRHQPSQRGRRAG